MAKKRGLALVKHLIKELSPDERAQLFSYLSEFPDSGVESYDLTEEIDALKKHGAILPPEGSSDNISLVFIRDLVEVRLADNKIAHARFFPDSFAQGYPTFKNQIAITSEGFQNTKDQRAVRRQNLEAQGIHQTDAEFEAGFIEACDDAARLWVTEKAKRIAERISRHFPGMVADMMVAAIKGQTFYDFHEATKQLSPDKPLPSVKGIKKAVQDIAWRDLKPHLPSTKYSRTPPDWRGEETLKRYAQQVTDRRALATRIREMYEDCLEGPGWMEDLKTDSTFERLSVGVPEPVLVWAMKRVASDESGSERERQAVSIALEMARQELALPELDIETLRNKYDEGNKLLKADRVKKPDH
jgi:hypothetical protein